MSLPSCFVPTDDVALTLHRVQKGYDVSWENAKALVAAEFIEIVSGPTAGSGYSITADGLTAWQRWVDGVVAEAMASA